MIKKGDKVRCINNLGRYDLFPIHWVTEVISSGVSNLIKVRAFGGREVVCNLNNFQKVANNDQN